MTDLDELRRRHDDFRAMNLSLNIERGQPADRNFDLSNPMLNAVGTDDIVTDAGTDVRNYPGGVLGLPEARELFAKQLRVEPAQMLVGNASSLELMGTILSRALLNGARGGERGWIHDAPKLIVTVPGYDRHFQLAESLGFELVGVPMTPGGPDVDAVEALVADDASIKGLYFVPTYSNPTGDCLSTANAERLAGMSTAAPDFTVFADDAYAVHHLDGPPTDFPRLLEIAEAAGNPDRVLMFGSTSKVTFAGGGLCFMAANPDNLAFWAKRLSAQSIGPNKVEQWRHVRFLREFPGGLEGLMREHATILKPKFDAVQEVLDERLGNRGLANVGRAPTGGYFVSLDAARPVADRVVALAKQAGVALTPPGATHPGGTDPANRTLRLAPTRPPLDDVRLAMRVVACCIELASAEHDAEGCRRIVTGVCGGVGRGPRRRAPRRRRGRTRPRRRITARIPRAACLHWPTRHPRAPP